MALIECSQCRKPISNSAKVCPHCGYSFVEEKLQREKANEFSKISADEQRALREEYDLQYPELCLAEKKINKRKKTLLILAVLSYVLLAIAVILLMVAVGFKADAPSFEDDAVIFDDNAIMFNRLMLADAFFLILLIADLIAYYVLRHMQKKLNVLRLKELKNFQIWLKKNKDLTYNVILGTQKERDVFNSFTEE